MDALLTVRDILAMPPFAGASQLVAGEAGLDHEVRWAHVVDIPQAGDWVRPGELLLTTFYGLRDDPIAQVRLCSDLAAKGLAGMVVAVGKYLDRVPADVRSAANAADFPIVELAWDVPFEDALRGISERLINDQYQLYKQSLAIHRTLTRLVLDAGSLQDVAAELCGLLHRPVEIDDVSFSVLAAAPAAGANMDQSRRDAIRTGQSSPALLEHLRRTGVLSRVRTRLGPERIDVSPETRGLGMTMSRILAPIVVARAIYGYVWIIAGNRDLEPLDFHAIEHAATVAALIIFRDQTAHQAEERTEQRLLGQLLAEGPRVDSALRESASHFRLHLDAPHAVLVADPARNDHRTLETIARQAARYLGLPVVVGERAGRIVVLLECMPHQAVEEYVRRLVETTLPLEEPVYVGASAVHAEVSALAVAYEQALEALALRPALNPDRRHASFDELGILHWLQALPSEVYAQNVYARHIQRLAESDRARGGELLRTLEVFLEADGNGVRAAERLIVHRHTLKYRLRRIEAICGLELDDPLCKLNLRAALLARALRPAPASA
jgi:purine catabolism regulator